MYFQRRDFRETSSSFSSSSHRRGRQRRRMYLLRLLDIRRERVFLLYVRENVEREKTVKKMPTKKYARIDDCTTQISRVGEQKSPLLFSSRSFAAKFLYAIIKNGLFVFLHLPPPPGFVGVVVILTTIYNKAFFNKII